MSAVAPGPVAPGDRLAALDSLRGLAVLGILAVNAMAFAWPIWLEFTPQLMEVGAPADRSARWVVEVFFADKFRTLFSLMFGVSLLLVGGEGGDTARETVLKRRLIWLAVFGLIHGAAFWYGDILLHYAYCGALAAIARSWPAARLLWVGGGISAAWAFAGAGSALTSGGADPQSAAFMAQATGYLSDLTRQSIEATRSGWAGMAIQNLIAWGVLQGMSLMLVPVTVPLMLLGMGLYKTGFFHGRRPGLIALFVLGAAINLGLLGWARSLDPLGVHAQAAAGAAVLISLGYAGVVIAVAGSGLRVLARVFAPAGRMAFTNYLTQTLVMWALFSLPAGPQWYGQMGQAALWSVVAAIWVGQLAFSALWLSVFRYGPFEWVWRRLSYGRPLPILRRGAA